MSTPEASGEASPPAATTTLPFPLLFEQCPLGIVLYDRSLRVIASNEAMARLIGVSRSRIDGLHIDDLRDQRHRGALQRALAGETTTYESPYQATQSDLWLWASITFAPLREEAGDVIAVMCVIDAHPPRVDVARCSTSEIQLGEAQRLGRVGSWTWDNDRQLAAASPEFYRILGVSPERISLATEFERFIHVDDREAVRRHFEEACAAQSPFSTCEFHIVRADGVERSVVLRAEVTYGSTGRASSAWGTMQDVTERRQLEEQLRRAHRMESLGQLASGVAHDFNNLLTVIRIEADFLEGGLATNHPLHQDIREVRLAADRAAGLTRQLLAFSRRQILHPILLDLNHLLRETSNMLRRLIGEDIELITNLSPELPKVLADPGQLEQVVMNLVVNARDAMPNGGRLLLETAVTAVMGDPILPADDYVTLIVGDTGCGIEPSLRQHVFDPFFTTKPHGKGTGLGLSTVLGIVEQSGGSITMDSQPGCGTRFTIHLPRARLGGSTVDPATQSPLSRRKRRATALLVEDEEPLRNASQRALEQEGYTVLVAEDGYDALAVATAFSGRIDILVTDMVLPGLSGREVAARLLSKRSEMRILYMTGYTDDGFFAPGPHDEHASILQKPFNLGQLADAVLLALLREDCESGRSAGT
jgi:two-component system, cell cycle sensor histidine kinase and response regulator CckA